MSYSFSMSLTDDQFEEAMEHYETDGLKETKKQIKSDLKEQIDDKFGDD